MKFNNHCTEELYNEAKQVISTKDWHPLYKDQLLVNVEDFLERGNWVRTETGGHSVPFNVGDVSSIVTIVSDREY
jgi:hypothetical protein